MTEFEHEHYQRLIKAVEHNSLRHPWYGPCDAFGDDYSCAECNRLFSILTGLAMLYELQSKGAKK